MLVGRSFALGVRSFLRVEGTAVAYRSFRNLVPQREGYNRESLFVTQVREARTNPMKFRSRQQMNTGTVGAVIEPTPPKLRDIRSFFDTKRWSL